MYLVANHYIIGCQIYLVYVVQELKNGTSTESKTSITAVEERTIDQETVVYENKLVYD